MLCFTEVTPESTRILGWKYLSGLDVQVFKQKTERHQTHVHTQQRWARISSNGELHPVQQERILPSAGLTLMVIPIRTQRWVTSFTYTIFLLEK